MIRINLLPEDLRKQEGTPLPRRIAIFAGAGLITLLAFLVLIQRVQIRRMRQEKDEMGEKFLVANKRIQQDVAPIEQSLAALERRQQVLKQIAENAVRWGGRMDGLQEVVVENLDGVWLDGFGYEERKSKEKGKGDQMERVFTVNFVASDFSDNHTLFSMSNEERIAEVGRRLAQNRGFMQDVIGIAPSTWAQTDDFLKAPWNVKAITFPLTFSLRAPVVDKPAPPKKPAEKKEG